MVEDFEVKSLEESIRWARSRWALNKEAATGKELIFTLRGDKELKDVKVKLHFAIYDKIPVIRKWFEVENGSSMPLNIDHFQLEYLAFAEPESPHPASPRTIVPARTSEAKILDLFFMIIPPFVSALKR